MKRCFALLFVLLFCATGCAAARKGSLAAKARQNKDLLLEAAREMKQLGAERVYVALEAPEETETGEGETQTAAERLVRYGKNSDKREELENETLERVLKDFGFVLILFQTASDGRESVIFSTGKESQTGYVQGVSFSFDDKPVAWWGRSAELTKHKGRYVEYNLVGDAWYYTVSLGDDLWYWEKSGDLLR